MSRTLGLTPAQTSIVFDYINGPEQSSADWRKAGNGGSIFGYCENIDDGRGVTMGIAGFTSKTGELTQLLRAYGISSIGDPKQCPKSRKENTNSQCAVCDWIKAHENDPKWINAQWAVYEHNYLTQAVKYVPAKFKGNALITAMLVDAFMNSGAGDEEGNAWGADHMARAATGNTPEEWVNSFCDFRKQHFATGNPPSGIDGRLKTWRNLAAAGMWDLKGANPCSRTVGTYCYGKGPGDGCSGC